MNVTPYTCLRAIAILAALCGLWLAGSSCRGDAPPFDYPCEAETGSVGAATLAIDVGATEDGSVPPGDDDEEEKEDDDGAGGPADGYLADGPYDAARGHGWLGEGEAAAKASWFVDFFPVGTHDHTNPWSDHAAYHQTIAPYLSYVSGLTGYRVDVPDGAYRVTLMFTEPSFPEPGLRVFDVSSNGVVLLDNLDLAARAGQDQIVDIAVQALAKDGAIELTLTAETDELPVLAGLRVEPAVEGGPDASTTLENRAGAGEGMLRWDRPADPTRGWLVARSVDGGEFEAVSGQLALGPSFVDGGRTAGEQLSYRVWPVGADCTAGPPTDSAAVTVLDATELGLPVIDVTVDAEEFASIHADPSADLEAAVTVTCGTDSGSGIIRLRGQSTRWVPKRSFYLKLDSGTLDGRDRIKLLAEQNPPSRLWQLAGYDLFARLGSPAPAARPVLLRINGSVYGVYDDIEHVGDRFLESRGYGVDDRFRAGYVDFGLRYNDQGGVDLAGFEKKENEAEPSPELEQLLIWLNTAAEHQLDEELAQYLDVDRMVDYMAGQILIANPEVIDGAHYLILDPASGLFWMVPWDLNNDTWDRSWLPLATNTAYEAGGGFHYWLWTRVMGSPTFREQLVTRLEELSAVEFAQTTPGRIDDLEQFIGPALAVEPFLFTRRYDDWVDSGPPRMQAFIDERAATLDEALMEFAQLGQTGPVIATVAGGNGPHVTLENRGMEEVSLVGCHLSTDAYELAMLELEGWLEPGGTVSIEFDGVAVDGGYLVLSCVGEGEGEGEGEESAARITSIVFYPPLASGEVYRRTEDSWAVVGP